MGESRIFECRYWCESDWDDWTNEWIPEGFRDTTIIYAHTLRTHGQAKMLYIRYLQHLGYDPVWTDKFSIRLQKG